MRNNPCPICKNPIKDLLILEVDEKVKDIGFDDKEEIKEDVIDVKEDQNNNKENKNDEENNINNEQNNIDN